MNYIPDKYIFQNLMKVTRSRQRNKNWLNDHIGLKNKSHILTIGREGVVSQPHFFLFHFHLLQYIE